VIRLVGCGLITVTVQAAFDKRRQHIDSARASEVMQELADDNARLRQEVVALEMELATMHARVPVRVSLSLVLAVCSELMRHLRPTWSTPDNCSWSRRPYSAPQSVCLSSPRPAPPALPTRCQ
jgi:hypothetical protein